MIHLQNLVGLANKTAMQDVEVLNTVICVMIQNVTSALVFHQELVRAARLMLYKILFAIVIRCINEILNQKFVAMSAVMLVLHLFIILVPYVKAAIL